MIFCGFELESIPVRSLTAFVKMSKKVISCVTGVVCEVGIHKSVVSFLVNGRHELAILKREKLFINGRQSRAKNLTEVLEVNLVVEFWAHNLSRVGIDNCSWFITHGIIRDFKKELENRTAGIAETVEYTEALHARVGRVFELEDHIGKIGCVDSTGAIYVVVFFASNFYIGGKNCGPNKKLTHLIEDNDVVSFDAVPTHPSNNIKGCEWFAIRVWIGKRPFVYEIETPSTTYVYFSDIKNETSYRRFLGQMRSSKALYVKAKGKVKNLINRNFGIVKLMMETDVVQTALFHKSNAFVQGNNMRYRNMRKYVNEGDKVYFIGVEAPKGLKTQFVAVEVNFF